MVIGIINFVIIVGAADILLPAAWVYAAVIAVTVMVEIALIFLKDKNKLSDNKKTADTAHFP